MTGRPVLYAGIATRAVGLAIDMALIHIVVLSGCAVLALVASLVGEVHLDALARMLAGVAWLAVVGTYFVLFWSAAGQTLGMRVMGLRLATYAGRPPSVGRSVVRLFGLALAIIPLFLGFAPALLDPRRRALPDFLAGTVVFYADAEPPSLTEVAAPAGQGGGRHPGRTPEGLIAAARRPAEDARIPSFHREHSP